MKTIVLLLFLGLLSFKQSFASDISMNEMDNLCNFLTKQLVIEKMYVRESAKITADNKSSFEHSCSVHWKDKENNVAGYVAIIAIKPLQINNKYFSTIQTNIKNSNGLIQTVEVGEIATWHTMSKSLTMLHRGIEFKIEIYSDYIAQEKTKEFAIEFAEKLVDYYK